MKNRLKFILLLVAVTVSICYFGEKQEQLKVVGLVLNNVTALADSESGDINYACLEDGSLDCKGMRAKYIVESTRLKMK